MMGIKRDKGFTIVELLIVIVVIGILAAITIVAYNGIQQRAANTAITSGVSNFVKLTLAYKASEGDYPVVVNGNYCIAQDNDCISYATTITNYGAPNHSNASLMTALEKYGTPPSTITHASSVRYGGYYTYSSSFTLNSIANPVMVAFWMQGANQDCTVIANMVSVHDTPNSPTSDFTEAPRVTTKDGQTLCYEMFPN